MLEALERWLRLSAERIHDQSDALTALDRAIGDGDHGLNMDRGFSAITAQLDAGLPDGETDQARAGAVEPHGMRRRWGVSRRRGRGPLALHASPVVRSSPTPIRDPPRSFDGARSRHRRIVALGKATRVRRRCSMPSSQHTRRG
jgi:hypothetical protein